MCSLVLGSQLNCFSKGNVTAGLKERFHSNMTDEFINTRSALTAIRINH